MSLKALLKGDEFEALDETMRGLYKEGEDGSYALDVDGLDDHPTVSSLRNGHRRSKQERDEAKSKAQSLERRFGKLAEIEGLDLSGVEEERITTLMPFLTGERELPELDDDGKLKHKGKEVDLDKVKDLARKPLQRELDTTKEENGTLKKQLRNLVTDGALTSAISEIKVAGPYNRAVKAMFKDQVKLVDDDDGNPIAVIEGDYGEQPVGKYLKEWAQTDEGKAFLEADSNTGGGAPPNSRGGKVKNPWSKDDWSPKEQGRIYRELGADTAKRMAAEHGKKVL